MWEIDVENGGLILSGFPYGSKAFAYSTKLTRRMIALRVAQKLLNTSEDALNKWHTVCNDFLLAEALIAYACGQYAACFQQGERSPLLNANDVFAGNRDAIERHEDWMRFRHKRYNHISEVGRTFTYMIVVDKNCDLLDGITISLDASVALDRRWLQLLFQLVKETQKYVSNAQDKCFERIKDDVGKLTREQILSLPRATIPRPSDG